MNPDQPRGRTTSILALSTTPASPYFYIQTFAYGDIIVMPSSAVITELETATSRGNDTAALLLEQIRKDLPISRDTDLFRYGMTGPEVFYLLQRMSAELLDSRQASVFSAWNSRFLDKISVERENSPSGSARHFKDANGAMFMFVADCIAD